METKEERLRPEDDHDVTIGKDNGQTWGCVVLVLGVVFLLMLPSIIEAIGRIT